MITLERSKRYEDEALKYYGDSIKGVDTKTNILLRAIYLGKCIQEKLNNEEYQKLMLPSFGFNNKIKALNFPDINSSNVNEENEIMINELSISINESLIMFKKENSLTKELREDFFELTRLVLMYNLRKSGLVEEDYNEGC